MACGKPPTVAEHMRFFLTKRADVPRDATEDDRSNLDECEGWVSKLSQRGAWQGRFFSLNNAYLVYHAAATKAGEPLGAIDLSQVRCAPPASPGAGCVAAFRAPPRPLFPPSARPPSPAPPHPPHPALSASPWSPWTWARASSSW